MKLIQSRENPFFKELVKLTASARQRSKSNQTLLDGAHLLAAYLDAGMMPQHVLLNAMALHDGEIAGLLERITDVPVTQLDDKLFAELSDLKTPTGILALIGLPQPAGTIADSRFALLLEDIQDPGNLGSMLRSAAAAGCDAVFLSPGCADAWSPKVLRAAMGGHFALRIYERQDLPVVAKAFSGTLLATSLQATRSLYDCDLRGNVAFLIGNEGAGLPAGLLKLATQRIAIPMHGQVESLNAAAAAAICLFEAVRQREGP
ncbi:MAG: RNA methyltransferase [Gallionella sp.]